MQNKTKVPRRAVHGVLLLDKPVGFSSNDALMKAKRLLLALKAGHTGTLDPFATGLLPLCFGEATKFSQDLLEADKTYDTTVHLGVCTDTGDTEGQIIAKPAAQIDHLTALDVNNAAQALTNGGAPDTMQAAGVDVSQITLEQIEAVLAQFRGPISQVPPMYSALKRDGKPLYEYARAGITLEREARNVVIHQLELLDYQAPFLKLRVKCSKGTYIRVLGEDIGAKLGCGAHLNALRRIQVGALGLDGIVTLAQLEAMTMDQREQVLAPVDHLISTFPAVTLPMELADRFMHGQRIALYKHDIASPGQGRARVYDANGRLLGTALCNTDDLLAPERLVLM
jgi:tRNA pseudouridine55 synthase